MKILGAHATNFGSYRSLTLPTTRGLSLVSGPTGSGKSTLCDMVPWVLYGCTSKNGSVDEIRSWNTDEATVGRVTLGIFGQIVTVTRSRKPNDLYFTLGGGSPTRGKDLADTQRQLERVLGMSAEAFLSASYFHEFSDSAGFFTAKARERRELTEQQVDLSLIMRLTGNASIYRSKLKAERSEAIKNNEIQRSLLESYDRDHRRAQEALIIWANKKIKNISELADKAKQFDNDKSLEVEEITEEYLLSKAAEETEIELITSQILPETHFIGEGAEIEARKACLSDETCEVCGRSGETAEALAILQDERLLDKKRQANQALLRDIQCCKDEIRRIKNHYDRRMKEVQARTNTYLEQAEELAKQENPYDQAVDNTTKQLLITRANIQNLDKELQDLNLELSDTESLLEVTADFRSYLVKYTIAELENTTNNILNKHFDAEIRVTFNQAEDDKLEVEIRKDGNLASYSQLSKGQRQLLRLSFGVAVMKNVALHHSVKVPMVMFDEALTGLDTSLKLKAHNLFKDLATEYDDVFVVEHDSDLKAQFENHIEVELVNGWSQLA